MAHSSPERTFNTKLLKQHVELHSDRREFLDPISLTIVVPIQARFVIPCEQRLVGIFRRILDGRARQADCDLPFFPTHALDPLW